MVVALTVDFEIQGQTWRYEFNIISLVVAYTSQKRVCDVYEY